MSYTRPTISGTSRNRSVSPVSWPAAVSIACACPRWWVWWLKKWVTRSRSGARTSRLAAPLNQVRSSVSQASSTLAAQRQMSASALSRVACSSAKSSIMLALPLIGVVAPQDVGQGAVDRAPKRPVRLSPLGVRQPRGRTVEPAVHLRVVFGHSADIGGSDHRGSFQGLSLADIEDMDPAVFRAGNDQIVRSDGNTADCSIASVFGKASAGREIPQAQRVVLRAGEGAGPVGQHRHRVDPAGVAFEGAQGLAG